MLSLNTPEYSHKWKEILGTRAVLHTFVDNQVILEPILYLALKSKQTSKAVKLVFGPSFSLFAWLISVFFLSLVKMRTFQDRTVTKKLQFVMETRISTISNAGWRVKLVDHFFFILLRGTYRIIFEERHWNIIELTSCVMLYDWVAKDIKKRQSPLKTPWSKDSQTIRRQIADELFECVWPVCGIGV